MLPFFELNSG